MVDEALQRLEKRGGKPLAVILEETDQLEDDRARLAAVLLHREEAREGREIAWHRVGLRNKALSPEAAEWLRQFQPEVVVGFPGGMYYRLCAAGFRIPEDCGFCGIPMPEVMAQDATGATTASGMWTSGREFQTEALELSEQLLRLGLRGRPAHPLVRVVTAYWQEGPSLGSWGVAPQS